MTRMNYWSKSFKTGHKAGSTYRHKAPTLTANQKKAMKIVGLTNKPLHQWTAKESNRYQTELKNLNK